MSTAATTYPPPPQRRTAATSNNDNAEDSLRQTLYTQSPHHTHDSALRRRRARLTCGLDPLHIVALIVLLGLLLARKPELLSLDTYLLRGGERGPIIDDNDACTRCKTPRTMAWQKTFTLPSNSKGCHLVTPTVEREIAPGLKGVKAGLITLFIQHTSAALSINENYDSTVRTDMTMALDRIVPESLPWKHTDEGPDDSASHTKASLFGSSITIPITDGRLNLGTWQGIYLCEFREMKHSRRVVATVLP